MSAMDALLAARAAWERTQPQTFLDFDALTDPDRDDAAPAGQSPARFGGSGAQASSANPAGSVNASTRLPDAHLTLAPECAPHTHPVSGHPAVQPQDRS